jgi:hypothetical protein
MDVVRLGSLDEVCFGKGSAHRLPEVLRGREGPPYGSRGLTGGRLSVAGFVVHDSDFHADLSGLTISSQKESLVRDLVFDYVVCLGLSIFGDWSREGQDDVWVLGQASMVQTETVSHPMQTSHCPVPGCVTPANTTHIPAPLLCR